MPIEQSKCETCKNGCFAGMCTCKCHTPASPKNAEWEEPLRIAWLLSSGEPKDFLPLLETVTRLLLQQQQKFVEEKRGMIGYIPKHIEIPWGHGREPKNLREILTKLFLP